VVDPSKKMPDLNCEVQDVLLEIVDLKQEVPDLRSGGSPPPNLTPAVTTTQYHYVSQHVMFTSSTTDRMHLQHDTMK